MVGTQGGLAAFGQASQHLAPFFLHPEPLRRDLVGIQCRAPDPGHLFNVGWAALATFDLHRFDADSRQLRQQVQGVEAGGFFQRMETLATDQEAAFAQGRISGRFFGV